MKIKLLVAAAATVVASSAMAQSAFEGAYGQVGIGYESMNPGFTNGTITGGQAAGQGYSITSSNANSFAGNIGIGAYFGVTKSFLLGVGAEYSPLAGSSQNFTFSIPNLNYVEEGGTYKKKNSYNIFLSPALAIDKNKLAYAKIGYTGLSAETSSDGQKDTFNYTGYSLGLGYKQIINGGLYGFGEVNYASYGSKSLGAEISGSSKPTTMNALVGVGYKF
jgi:hypothetical protein